MTIHHHIHLSFILLFAVTAFFCVLVIIKKMNHKKRPKLLEKEKYNSTITEKMLEIKTPDTAMYNIWPYVSRLKTAKILSHKVKERELVYKVYRNSTEEFEHVLLSTEKENNFIVIVIDKIKKKIVGYSLLEPNGEYGLAV